MADSGGCNHIILVCGTAHAFLPDVYQIEPEFQKYVLNIIDITREYLLENGVNEIFLIAAEGTLRKKVYNGYFEVDGIKVGCPNEDEYYKIRHFIEAVKQDKIDNSVMDDFMAFLSYHNATHVVLGCTEFPVLVSKIRKSRRIDGVSFVDPLELTIKKLKEIIE